MYGGVRMCTDVYGGYGEYGFDLLYFYAILGVENVRVWNFL